LNSQKEFFYKGGCQFLNSQKEIFYKGEYPFLNSQKEFFYKEVLAWVIAWVNN